MITFCFEARNAFAAQGMSSFGVWSCARLSVFYCIYSLAVSRAVQEHT